MGLRLREGIDLAAMSARFGLAETALLVPAKAELYQQQGLVWQNGVKAGVTEAGMPLLDALLGELVPAELVDA